ncbi:MAG: Ig-like domain-containing protein [Anaeromyxobacteraceae bacterium]
MALLVLGGLSASCDGGGFVLAPQQLAVDEDGVLRGALVVEREGDGGEITFMTIRAPAHGTLTLDPASGTFEYRPAPHFNGGDLAKAAAVAVTGTSSAPLEIQVLPVNDPPDLPDATLVLQEDGEASLALAGTDVDGDRLTYALEVPPTHGRATLDADGGALTYVADADWFGADTVVVSASDGALTSRLATVQVAVLPVNDPPVALDAVVQVAEDGEVADALAAADLDGPGLTFTLASPPAHGTVQLEPLTGAYVYRPGPDFHGADAFSFTASDGLATSLPATLAIQVSPVNDAPMAAGAAFELDEDGALEGAVAATDVDSPIDSYALSTSPAHGRAELDPARGTFRYTPDPDYVGPDVFSFTASDGTLDSAPATVQLTVRPVNDPPVASDLALILAEDGSAQGRLEASDVDGDAPTFALRWPAAHGQVSLAADGTFSYAPEPDWNGVDDFIFVASDGTLESAPHRVQLTVAPVDDPPRLPALPDLTNSAETQESLVTLPLLDPDGEEVLWEAWSDDLAVVTVRQDVPGALRLTPVTRGRTRVTVTGTDGRNEVSATFAFTVTDVTKTRTFESAVPGEQAIRIENQGASAVAFTLDQNGARLATSVEELLAEVRAQPDEVPQEPFERKLWRYLRDASYHGDPLTVDYWAHDPVAWLGGVGFGYCDDVAAVYTTLAIAAGLEARAWELEGHVVPEVHVSGRWEMYDPDLAVYYRTRDGAVAGVEDLEADPSLVTTPTAPLRQDPWVYGETVAAIYASASDNHVISGIFFEPPRPRPPLKLPAGAAITYPGVWTEAPKGYAGVPTLYFAELRLDLPDGFVGVIDLPFALRAVSGKANVKVGGVVYDAETQGLNGLLERVGSSRAAVQPLEVVESRGALSLVYLMNPRFAMVDTTSVALTSLEAAALSVGVVSLPESERLPYVGLAAVNRPR